MLGPLSAASNLHDSNEELAMSGRMQERAIGRSEAGGSPCLKQK